MHHPYWYYTNYTKIIARSEEAYDRDVRTISSIEPLKGKHIQEVGAGTGEHAIRLLKYGAASIHLVDTDPEAVKLLNTTFSHLDNAYVIHGDGFALTTPSPFDIIICMYSVILQGIDDMTKLEGRFRHVLSQIKSQGVLFIEVIDYDVSMVVYPPGLVTTVYEDSNSNVQICSHYAPNHITIMYFGKLNDIDISYNVSIFGVTHHSLSRLFQSLNMTDFSFVPLDEHKRRLLVCLRK